MLVFAGATAGASLTWVLGAAGGGPEVGNSSSELGRPPSVRSSALGGLAGGTSSWVSAAESVRAAQAIADRHGRASALRDAGSAAAARDLVSALSEGSEIESNQDSLEFHRGLYGEWAERDPEAALEHAKTNFTPGQLQAEAISIGINKWGAENPREAWVWVESNLSGPLKDQALTDLMIGWTRRSPGAAASWLRETGYTSRPLFNAVAGTLAEVSPTDAAQWAESLPDPKLKETARLAVANEWTRQNPDAAGAYFEGAVEAPGGVNLATAITSIWGTTDPASTADWVNSLEAGPGREEAAATLATVWAAMDIHGAVAWSESLGDPTMRADVIAHIATTWGAIEPGPALEWLDGLAPEVAAEGYLGAYNSWAATDPNGMLQYLDSAAGDPALDPARRSLGDVLSGHDLPGAMEIALGMASPQAQEDALARYFREWRKVDESGAFDWLGSHWESLTAASQERLGAVAEARLVRR